MNFVDLDTFERVATHGTLAAAARELGVPKSTVSRRLTRLEEEFGVDLLHRGGRRITLTQAGAELHRRSSPPLVALRELDEGLTSDKPRGTLRVTASHDLGTNAWFAGMLTRFRQAHPGVVVDLVLTARVVDLIGEGFDVALRPATSQPDTDDLMVRLLGDFHGRLFASPTHLADAGVPTTIDELATHRFVGMAWMRQHPVTLVDAGGARHEFSPHLAAVGSDLSAVLALVSAGMGIGLLPENYVADPVDVGALAPVLPALHSPLGRLAMVWPRGRFLLPRVRAFVDFFLAEFERAWP